MTKTSLRAILARENTRVFSAGRLIPGMSHALTTKREG
jgi:hypothetical protein